MNLYVVAIVWLPRFLNPHLLALLWFRVLDLPNVSMYRYRLVGVRLQWLKGQKVESHCDADLVLSSCLDIPIVDSLKL